jgi:hypothetical protein
MTDLTQLTLTTTFSPSSGSPSSENFFIHTLTHLHTYTVVVVALDRTHNLTPLLLRRLSIQRYQIFRRTIVSYTTVGSWGGSRRIFHIRLRKTSQVNWIPLFQFVEIFDMFKCEFEYISDFFLLHMYMIFVTRLFVKVLFCNQKNKHEPFFLITQRTT